MGESIPEDHCLPKLETHGIVRLVCAQRQLFSNAKFTQHHQVLRPGLDEENRMSTDFSEEIDNNIARESYEASKNCMKHFSQKFFTKTVLKPGHGFLRPYLESVCILDIYDRTVDNVDDVSNCESLQKLQIPVGKNIELILCSAETEAVRILEKCILTMRKGEESNFVLNFSANHFYTQKEENSSLLLNIILHDFSETKPMWSLYSGEKYQLALLHKEKGTDFFKNGKTEAAFCQYSIAIIYIICIPECTSVMDDRFLPEAKSEKEMYNTLKCICYLNLAACQMKVGNYRGVIKNCTHALSLDSSSVKGLYRRAEANLACGRVKEARSDLNQANKIEPKNRAVYALLQSCNQK